MKEKKFKDEIGELKVEFINDNLKKLSAYPKKGIYCPDATYLTNYPIELIEFDIESTTIHETQKPVKLIEYLIQTYSNEGNMVLDNTMGSGTTGVGCVNTNRKFIGIEIEKKYFDLSCDRLKNLYLT